MSHHGLPSPSSQGIELLHLFSSELAISEAFLIHTLTSLWIHLQFIVSQTCSRQTIQPTPTWSPRQPSLARKIVVDDDGTEMDVGVSSWDEEVLKNETVAGLKRHYLWTGLRTSF